MCKMLHPLPPDVLHALLGVCVAVAVAWFMWNRVNALAWLVKEHNFVLALLLGAMAATGVYKGFAKYTNDPPNMVGSVGSRVPSDRNAGNIALPIADADITNSWRVAETREGCEIVARNAIEKFKTRVQQLAGMLDARGCDSYSLAYDLCKEATADSQTNLYEILSGIYVKAATNISFDIEHDAQGEEKEHNRLEVRLRNQWNISQWAALTIFFRNPEKIEGWNILLDVILKERKAATAADSAMPGLNLNDRRQSTQYRRLEHFKKEMGLEEDSQLRRINHIYHSISHRLTLEQRAAIVSHVKSVLGKLPSEMEKDLPQAKKERH